AQGSGGGGVRGAAGRGGAYRGQARGRAGAVGDQLHVGDDRAAEGGDVPPPRRVSACVGDGGAHRVVAVGGAPVDVADVPLQRLVFPVGGDRGGGHARVPAEGGPGRGVAADPRRAGDPPGGGADGAVDARLRAAG